MRRPLFWVLAAALLTGTLLCPGYAAPSSARAVLSTSDEPPDSERFIIRQWTTADGLPVNYVGDIIQGSDGYLWLTGGGGLVRFDGREFKVFTRTDIDGWETSSVINVYKDRDEALWLVSERGTLTRYRSGRFHTYDWRAPVPNSTQFYEGRDGVLWIGSGPQIVRVEGKTVARFSVVGKGAGNAISGFHEDERGRLWAFSPDALLRRRGSRFVVVDTTRPVDRVVKRDAGGVWVATRASAYRFENGRFTPLSLSLSPSESIEAMQEDPRGRLWIGTSSGRLICVNGNKRRVYTSDAGLPPRPIINIYEQHNGRLWIEAESHGLFYLTHDRFKRVPLGEYQSPPRVSDFAKGPEGNLWVGMTTTGLLRLSPRVIGGYTREDGLPADLVFPILQDEDGTVWMGTYGGGLHRLDTGKRSGSKTTFTTADGLPGNKVRSLHESRAGGMWVGARGGVARLQGNSIVETHAFGSENRVIRALYEDDRGQLWVGSEDLLLVDGDSVRRYGPERLRHGHVTIRAIHEDQSDAIWVATREGLFRKKNGHWRRFTTEDGLSSNFLLSIHEEEDGTLWFTSHGGGLIRYLGDGEFFTYSTADGLHTNAIWQILEDDHGHFWMSSNTGLFRVRKQALETLRKGTIDRVSSRVFTVADGMPSSECAHAQPAGWKAQSGRLWFPTVKGVAIVDPSKVPAADRSPPVRLQQVRADGRTLDWQNTSELAAGKGNLAFRFAALNFSAPQRTRYRYKLEGYDERWQRAGTRRAAFYTNLPPGRYRFRVQARSGSGGWTPEGASFAFTLQPHVWQTAWFYLLCIAGLIGAFYGVHWIRLRHVREQELEEKVEQRTQALRKEKEKSEEQAERLRALDQAKSRLLTDLSHELRTPLTMVSTPLHTVLADAEDALPEDARELLDAALRNSERLEELVDQILDLSRLETGDLSLEPLPEDLVAFVREVVRSFEPLAERNDLSLRFRSDLERLPSIFDPEKLRSVLGNLIDNALKFTPKGGNVLVRLDRTGEKTASLRVSDTGPGIPKEERPHVFDRFHQGEGARRSEGSGLGLALAKELTELHGGTIQVESELGLSTTFTVRLPLRKPEDESVAPSVEGYGERKRIETDSQPSEAGGDGHQGASRPEEDFSAGEEEKETSSPDSRPTILVVEDNADVRTYLQNQLSDDYVVRETHGGEEALNEARAEPPDLVLSDVMMPDVDGLELCRRLKTDDELRDVPIVLLTARAGEEAQLEGLDAGADAYVEKPFSMETLRARIQALLDQRTALRDQYSDEVVMQPSGVSVTPKEKAFYEEARTVVETHIGEPGFTVEQFAGEMSVSRSTLRRRLKDATGQTPAQFVRLLRLERAAQLLRDDPDLRVYEVANAVGYESPDHFARLFRDHFDVSPSEYPVEE